jgi:hypothetical protein
MSTRSEHDTKVRLIRIDGHLPDGGYDVDHGGHEAEMSLGLASPRPLLRPPDRKQIGRAVASEGHTWVGNDQSQVPRNPARDTSIDPSALHRICRDVASMTISSIALVVAQHPTDQ